MPQPAPGVVSHKKGEPVSVKTIVIANSGRGETGVQVRACGVCHTDLHNREGGITNEFRLSHEAAGSSSRVGHGGAEVDRPMASMSCRTTCPPSGHDLRGGR